MEWALLAAGILVCMILYGFLLAGFKMKCAEKLGVPAGWTAFIPFLKDWLTGNMARESDRRRCPGKKTPHWNVWMLVVKILTTIFETTFLFSLIGLAGTFFSGKNRFVRNLLSFLFGQTENEFMKDVGTLSTSFLILILVTVLLILLSEALDYWMLYKIYSAFTPQKAGVFFVVTFFLPPAEAVYYMIFALSRSYPKVPAPQTSLQVQAPQQPAQAQWEVPVWEQTPNEEENHETQNNIDPEKEGSNC